MRVETVETLAPRMRAAGEHFWGVHADNIGSKAQPEECNRAPTGGVRCGVWKVIAREIYGHPCTTDIECDTIGGIVFCLESQLL